MFHGKPVGKIGGVGDHIKGKISLDGAFLGAIIPVFSHGAEGGGVEVAHPTRRVLQRYASSKLKDFLVVPPSREVKTLWGEIGLRLPWVPQEGVELEFVKTENLPDLGTSPEFASETKDITSGSHNVPTETKDPFSGLKDLSAETTKLPAKPTSSFLIDFPLPQPFSAIAYAQTHYCLQLTRDLLLHLVRFLRRTSPPWTLKVICTQWNLPSLLQSFFADCWKSKLTHLADTYPYLLHYHPTPPTLTITTPPLEPFLRDFVPYLGGAPLTDLGELFQPPRRKENQNSIHWENKTLVQQLRQHPRLRKVYTLVCGSGDIFYLCRHSWLPSPLPPSSTSNKKKKTSKLIGISLPLAPPKLGFQITPGYPPRPSLLGTPAADDGREPLPASTFLPLLLPQRGVGKDPTTHS